MLEQPLTVEEKQQQKSNRIVMLAIFATFAVPVLAAYLALSTGWYQSQGTINKGHLITPPIDISQLNIVDQNNTPFISKDEEKSWYLFYIMPSHCDQACKNSLFLMRQSHIALGPDQNRVKQVVIHHNDPSQDIKDFIAEEFPTFGHYFADSSSINQTFSTALENASESGDLFILDPLGFIMLNYPPVTDEHESILKGRDLLKDLKYLLKVSKIG